MNKNYERLELLLNNVCAYLAEIMHKDDMTAEHSKMAFGMTEEEHKKYILGENVKTKIKDWFCVSHHNGTLSIFIIDNNDYEKCVAEISDCGEMHYTELLDLARETLEDLNYEVK